MIRPSPSLVVRWLLVAVAAGSTAGLVIAPSRSPADLTAPLAMVACGALAVLVVLEARRPRIRAEALAAVAAALLVLAVAAPPRMSHDLWSYAMYGRIVTVHHANPYVARPSAFPSDPALHRVDPAWRPTRSVYGPTFTALSAGLAPLVGTNALATRVTYQSIAALAIGGVLAALVRRRRSAAVAAIGLHPLVIVYLVNGGHNDALVGLLLLGAVFLVGRRRPAAAGLVAAAAVTIKIVAFLPAIALVGWLWRRQGRRAALTAGVAVVGATAIAYTLVGGDVALRPLLTAADRVSRASVWRYLPVGDHHFLRFALLGLLVVVPAALGATARLDKSPAAVAAAGVIPFLLAAPYVLPWYFAWALPVAALAIDDDRVIAVILFLETLLVTLAYTYRVVPRPDQLDRALRTMSTATQAFELAALVTLVGFAVVVLWRRRRTRPPLGAT